MPLPFSKGNKPRQSDRSATLSASQGSSADFPDPPSRPGSSQGRASSPQPVEGHDVAPAADHRSPTRSFTVPSSATSSPRLVVNGQQNGSARASPRTPSKLSSTAPSSSDSLSPPRQAANGTYPNASLPVHTSGIVVGEGDLSLDHLLGPNSAPELVVETATDASGSLSSRPASTYSNNQNGSPKVGPQTDANSSFSSKTHTGTYTPDNSLSRSQSLSDPVNPSPSASTASLVPDSALKRPPSRSPSVSSRQNPQLLASHRTRANTTNSFASIGRKGRSSSAASGGIAGALALTGAALAQSYGAPATTNVGVDSDAASLSNDETGAGLRRMISISSFGALDDMMAGSLGPGYAVASSKRQNDFHALFRTVPEDDYLIEGKPLSLRLLRFL
jgi:hypothetical protein